MSRKLISLFLALFMVLGVFTPYISAGDENITILPPRMNNVETKEEEKKKDDNLPTVLEGDGMFAIESNFRKEELLEFELNDDVLKIDGNMAIAWSSSLDFRVERTTKTLIGSAASGEGFVNVYRGTGKVVMVPFQYCS